MSRADEELVRRQTWIRDVRSLRENYLGVESSKGLALLVRDVLRDRGIVKGKIGIAGVGVTWGLYNALVKVLPRSRFISCTEEVDRLRMVRTENELRIMHKAAEIGMAGVEALLETGREGVAEFEVHLAVEKAMFDAGGDGPWSVILSGLRSVIPYISPDYTQRKLRDGDMVYADIGTEFMGYHSDIQPAYIVGRGSKHQLRLIETSLSMIRVMIGATRPGVTDTQVLRAAYKMLDGNPFRDYVRTWTLGHGYGVGLDPPDLTGTTLTLPKDRQMRLQRNMLLCYEPGIFVPGVGGAAVEDEVIVTENGCEVLTKCAKRAEELLEAQHSA